MAAKHSRPIAPTAPLPRADESPVSLGDDASVGEMVRVASRRLKVRDEATAARSLASGAMGNAGLACAEI